MKFITIYLFFLSTTIFAQESSIMVKKGAKIAHILCDEKKLKTSNFIDKKDAEEKILKNGICPKLTATQLSAVVAYATSKIEEENLPGAIDVPKDAKCRVCGMYVAKYPKWVSFMQTNSKEKLYFDGVKDMMKYYFAHKNEKFDPILVKDFYTLKPVNAKKAFFVIGSNVYGPMGEELIPFKKEEDAKVFLKEHKGKKLITFEQIVPEYLY